MRHPQLFDFGKHLRHRVPTPFGLQLLLLAGKGGLPQCVANGDETCCGQGSHGCTGMWCPRGLAHCIAALRFLMHTEIAMRQREWKDSMRSCT